MKSNLLSHLEIDMCDFYNEYDDDNTIEVETSYCNSLHIYKISEIPETHKKYELTQEKYKSEIC